MKFYCLKRKSSIQVGDGLVGGTPISYLVLWVSVISLTAGEQSKHEGIKWTLNTGMGETRFVNDRKFALHFHDLAHAEAAKLLVGGGPDFTEIVGFRWDVVEAELSR